MKHRQYIIFMLFLLINAGQLTAQRRTPGSGLRFLFGPAYGFYTINERHAAGASPRMSVLAGFRKEIRVDREFRTFFLFGVDYFFHGLNFRSYYFSQDTLQLYDKSFEYSYALSVQELQLPLQMKFSFTRENNSVFSPYLIIGYQLRYLLPSMLSVSHEGARVKRDESGMKFKNPLFTPQLNSGLSVSAGWQKNSVNNSTSSFFIELNYRYGFSPYFIQKDYAASSLYMNSTHLSLLLGLKF